MPKKQKVVASESDDIEMDDDYNSEEMDDSEDLAGGTEEIREVNKDHLLNYESDDSDEDYESDDLE